MKTGNETASGNEVEWKGLGRWLFCLASSLEIGQPSSNITSAQELYRPAAPFNESLSTWEEGLNHYLMSHAEESTLHLLAGCSALAQTKYLARHNSLWVAKKTDNIPPWFSPTERKPAGENQRTKAYWDVLVYAQNTEVRVNTMNVRIINKEDKKVTLLEISCPSWKTEKQRSRRRPWDWCHFVGFELKMQKWPRGDNIIIWGASMNTAKSIKSVIRERPGRKTLRKMDKIVLSHSLNIAR